MMPTSTHGSFKEAQETGRKDFAVLIDPDQLRLNSLDSIIKLAHNSSVDYFFIGGSLIMNDVLDQCLNILKKELLYIC